MLGIALSPDHPLSLAEQIVAGVRSRIDDRVLRDGMRLPPIRQMASGLGVSRFTVVEAYDRLVASGAVSSRRGSGFYVSTPTVPGRPHRGQTAEPTIERTIERAFDNADVMREALSDDPARLKVGAGWLPAGWLDEEGLRRRLRALAGRDNQRLVCYGEPQGYRPLREQLRVRFEAFGFAAPPEQIVLTHGATQALDLVARTLLRPGDCALVDDPGYWNLFASLRLLGVRLIGVPRGIDGPDVATLEALLTEHRPKVFITHSVLHNPTSANLSPAIAHRVLQLATQHDLLVVEDDTYADYFPGHATRLTTLDGLDRVIYVGSFSKTLSANLRVGFLAARPDLARTFTDVKLFTSVGSSELAERLIHDMLTEGHYRKLIDRLRGRLAAATESGLRALEAAGFSSFAEPRGGMFVWACREGTDATELARAAAVRGIVLAPGHLFRPQLQATPYLRFNTAYLGDARWQAFLRETT
jgi:DNA-binding transcriptional MocR family regulator